MKTFRLIFPFALALFLVSCFSPYTGEGTVTVALPGNGPSRSILPGAGEQALLNYDITISAIAVDGPAETVTATLSGGASSYTASLMPGTWQIEVEAWKTAGGRRAVAGSGSASIAVRPGIAETIDIALRFTSTEFSDIALAYGGTTYHLSDIAYDPASETFTFVIPPEAYLSATQLTGIAVTPLFSGEPSPESGDVQIELSGTGIAPANGGTASLSAAFGPTESKTYAIAAKAGNETRNYSLIVKGPLPVYHMIAIDTDPDGNATTPSVPSTVTSWSSSTNYPIPSGGLLLDAYSIGETEVTYELWYAVRKWAEANGYFFGTPGWEGSTGVEGAVPTSRMNEPVTTVSWRSAIVWCNAYSELMGKTPQYKDGANLIKDAREAIENSSYTGAISSSPGAGFRLPTEAEWEYAARGGNASDLANWNLPAAGATTTNIADVAWYRDNSGGKTHPVGLLAPNSAGLYDMTGNVGELCIEIDKTSSYTGGAYFRGSDYREYASDQTISRLNKTGTGAYGSNAGAQSGPNVGFRPVCAPEN